MPFCLNCGREIPPGAKFCGNCGDPVQGGEQRRDKAQVPEQTVATAISKGDARPEGIRLLVMLSFVAAIVIIAFGILFVVIAPKAPGFGTIFVVIGIGTFVPRYGFSNAKSWGRSGGYALGIVYVILGVLFLAILQLVGALSLFFGIATLYYMTRPTAKAYFKLKGT